MKLDDQLDLFSAQQEKQKEIHLPVLHKSIRYYDGFSEEFRIIKDTSADTWTLEVEGRNHRLLFDRIPIRERELFKHLAREMLSRQSAVSVGMFIGSLLGEPKHVIAAFDMSPPEFRDYWVANFRNWTYINALSTRTAVHSLCNLSFGLWNPNYRDYVSLLPSPHLDQYRTVRTQECFLPLEDQSLLISYIDNVAERLEASGATRTPHKLNIIKLRDTCLLILSHQYAFRPGQIAKIKASDVRSLNKNSLHISVPVGKQRVSKRGGLVTRKIKSEWIVIFRSYGEMADEVRLHENSTLGQLYFCMTPTQVSVAIGNLTKLLTGERWVATDLRHTAAQRLADAGVSHISLSDFMTHATTLTANVYFNASPTQAERVNQALALSPIYSNVAEVARTRVIDKTTLMRLPPDQQIAGVPHGIPIAGIGGCSVGQSLCTMNPILSCYTCRKFLPLLDSSIHLEVVEKLRSVVTDFAGASRNNEESPAYTQLKRMLQAALRVAEEVRVINSEVVG
ncbi:site-specific integrase [Pseudomonas aeruginosa]|uniref:site-specific integrase n=2 Tax=Pseudomonas aeruginosa TaxID=287 RepID=UPI000F529472|nr:site-specific integrase [Pseudomonas aeruginosa]MDH0765432.1 site-specific integrase [Pseudomonas aeruginosa]MDH1041000.1 site-specific integrase [Pseudomonas aeruginosa]MDH1288410.1 site-specific integrase [Pseudomonas aeruginosa]HBO1083846.1 site-specific integrase [Pseudomonas aeruginosa]HBP6240943.1 site-specific integrase [Pseudomonas aeruginosa]